MFDLTEPEQAVNIASTLAAVADNLRRLALARLREQAV